MENTNLTRFEPSILGRKSIGEPPCLSTPVSKWFTCTCVFIDPRLHCSGSFCTQFCFYECTNIWGKLKLQQLNLKRQKRFKDQELWFTKRQWQPQTRAEKSNSLLLFNHVEKSRNLSIWKRRSRFFSYRSLHHSLRFICKVIFFTLVRFDSKNVRLSQQQPCWRGLDFFNDEKIFWGTKEEEEEEREGEVVLNSHCLGKNKKSSAAVARKSLNFVNCFDFLGRRRIPLKVGLNLSISNRDSMTDANPWKRFSRDTICTFLEKTITKLESSI